MVYYPHKPLVPDRRLGSVLCLALTRAPVAPWDHGDEPGLDKVISAYVVIDHPPMGCFSSLIKVEK